MDFAPSKQWKWPCITHLEDCRNRKPPTDSAEEAFMNAYLERAMPRRKEHLIAHGVMIWTAIWLIVTADSMTSLGCFVIAGSVMVLISQRWVARRRSSVHVIVWTAIAVPVF